MDSPLRLPAVELPQIPVENRLDGAANNALAAGKPVLEKGFNGTDQAIASRGCQPYASTNTMGMLKLWDSSGYAPFC